MDRETKEKEPEVKATQPKHPLMEFVPLVFRSFEEWLGKWEGTNYLAEKLGLLHSLSDKDSWWQEPELVSLLLSLADGFADESFDSDLSYPHFYGERIEAKGRKKIANKAFSVLCLRFFKGTTKEEGLLWWWMLKDETLFQKVLWFLRPRPSFKRLRNRICIRDGGDHQQEIFRNFLREFSHLGWKFSYPDLVERWDEETEKSVKQRLISVRPQLIEILCELRDLDWLNSREIDLDDESVRKLTEMALEDSLSLPPEKVFDGYSSFSFRKPKSLEEALLGGSVEAEIVVLDRIKKKERKRIKALYEASVRQNQEKRRIAELKRIEAEKKRLDDEAASL